MELQAYMIGAAVVLISAILIYFIAIITMREKSYDEIIEEQRRRHQEAFPAPTAPADKTKKKKKKRQRVDKGDTTEDEQKSDDYGQSEPVQKMVELELEPEVIPDVAPKPSKESKKDKKKNKPILLNKSEKSAVKEDLNVQETFHLRNAPMDAVELKHERERRLSECKEPHVPENQGKKKKEGKREPTEKKEAVEKREVVENLQAVDVIQQEQIIMTQAAPETRTTPKDKKNKKSKDAAPAEPASGDGGRLLQAVQGARLNDSDIPMLIEVLLGKQTEASSQPSKWTKKSQKGDPVIVLEKQLEEKNQALLTEQEQSNVLSRRIKELQQEVTREHHQYSLLEKESADKIAAHSQESQAMQLRMQQTHEQHMAEVNTLRTQMDTRKGQIVDGQTVILQRLKEENKQLQDKAANTQQTLKIVQDELNVQIQERSSIEGAKKAFEGKCMQYEDKIRKLENNQRSAESVLTQKLKEVSDQYQREQANALTLARDLDKATSERHQKDQDLANLRNIMKDLENMKGQRDEEVRALQAHLQSMKEENTALVTELQTVKERTSGEGQESPSKPQGEAAPVLEETPKDLDVLQRSHYDNIILEKDNEATNLRSQLSEQISGLEQLQRDLEAEKKKNNDLRQKNWKVMDALKQTEKMAETSSDLKSQLEYKDCEIKTLRLELSKLQSVNSDLENEKAKVAAVAAATSLEAQAAAKRQVEELKQELADSINQLDDKEGKLGDADSKLQKALSDLQALKQENDAIHNKLAAVEATSQRENSSAEQITSLLNQIKEKDNQLEIQTQELSVKKAELDEFVEQLKAKDTEFQSKTNQLQENDKRLAEVEQTLKERADEVAGLSKQIQDKENEIANHVQKLQEQESELKAQLQEKDNALVTNVQKLEEKEVELAEQVKKMQEKEQELSEQTQSANVAQIDELQSKIQMLDSELQQVRDQLSSKEQTIEQQTQQLENQDSQLKEQIQQKEQFLGEQAKQQEEAEHLLKQKLEQAEQELRQQLENKDQTIKQQNEQLDNLNKQITDQVSAQEQNLKQQIDEKEQQLKLEIQQKDDLIKNQEQKLQDKEDQLKQQLEEIENNFKQQLDDKETQQKQELEVQENQFKTKLEETEKQLQGQVAELETKIGELTDKETQIQREYEEKVEQLQNSHQVELTNAAKKEGDTDSDRDQERAELEKELATLRKENEELFVENQSLMVSQKELEGDLKSQDQQIVELSTEIDSHHTLLAHNDLENQEFLGLLEDVKKKDIVITQLQEDLNSTKQDLEFVKSEQEVPRESQTKSDVFGKYVDMETNTDEYELELKQPEIDSPRSMSVTDEPESEQNRSATDLLRTELVKKNHIILVLQNRIQNLDPSNTQGIIVNGDINDEIQSSIEDMGDDELAFAILKRTGTKSTERIEFELELDDVPSDGYEADGAPVTIFSPGLLSKSVTLTESNTFTYSADSKKFSYSADLKSLTQDIKGLFSEIATKNDYIRSLEEECNKLKIDLQLSQEQSMEIAKLEQNLVEKTRAFDSTGFTLECASRQIESLESPKGKTNVEHMANQELPDPATCDKTSTADSRDTTDSRMVKTESCENGIDLLISEVKSKDALTDHPQSDFNNKPGAPGINLIHEMDKLRSELDSKCIQISALESEIKMLRNNCDQELNEQIKRLTAELEFKVMSLQMAQEEVKNLKEASVTSAERLREFEKAHTELEAKSTAITTLQHELDSLKTSAKPEPQVKFEEEINNLKLEIEEKDHLIQLLETHGKNLNSDSGVDQQNNDMASQSLDSRDSELQALKLERSEFKLKAEKQIEALNIEIESKSIELTSLKLEVDALKVSLVSAEAENSKKALNSKNYDAVIEKLRGEHMIKNNLIEALQGELEVSQTSNIDDGPSQELVNAQLEIDKLRQKLDARENEIMTLKEQLATVQLSKTGGTLTYQERLIKSLQEERQQLKHQNHILDEASKGAKQLKQDLDSKSRQITSLKDELISLRANITDPKAQASFKIAQLEKEIDSKNIIIARLTEEVEQLKSELDGSSVDSDPVQETTAKLEKWRLDFEAMQSELQSKEQVFKLQEVELLSKIHEKEEENRQMMESLKNDDTKMKTVTNEMHSIEERNAALSDSLAAKTAEIDKMVGNVNEVQSNFDALQKQLTEALASMSSHFSSDEPDSSSYSAVHQMSLFKQQVKQLLRENDELRLGCEQATITLTAAEKSAEEIAQVQSRLASKVSEVHDLKKALKTRDQQISELKSGKPIPESATTPEGALTKKEVTVFTHIQEQAQWDMSNLILDLDTKNAELLILQSLLAQKEAALQGELNNSARVNAKLRAELDSCQASLQQFQAQIQLNKHEIAGLHDRYHEACYAPTLKENSTSDTGDLNDEINALLTEVVTLQSELEVQREENCELKEKLKLGNADNCGEFYESEVSDLKERSSNDATSQMDSLAKEKAALSEELSQTKEMLQKIFPQVQITNNTSQTWIVNLEKEITTRTIHTTSTVTAPQADTSEFEAELASAREVNSRLEGQVHHYKLVLSDTESILNKLQNSVESEEQKWVGKLRTSDDQLKKSQEENRKLLEQVDQLQNNSEQLVKIQDLEERLSMTESEKHDLKSQLSESTISLNSMRVEYSDYRTSTLPALDVNKEGELLKDELGNVLKQLKEMKMANVKLKGQLRIGECEVDKLEQELAHYKQSLTNGGSSIHEELDELRSKLKTTQQDLERELQANQQLTQKLAASAESESSEV